MIWDRTTRAGVARGGNDSDVGRAARALTSHGSPVTSHGLSQCRPSPDFRRLTSAFLIADPRLEIAVTRRKQRIEDISNRLKTGGCRPNWERQLALPARRSLGEGGLIATVANSRSALNPCESSTSHFSNRNKIGISAQSNDGASSVTIVGGTINNLAMRSHGGTR